MALTATMRRFEIALADSDRGVYADLDLRAAQHPSEADRYLVARIVARCLEHADGVELTRGLDADDEPAIWQRDLRGDLKAWIEIGTPSAERIHKASKTGARVVIYTYKRPEDLALAMKDVFRADRLEIYALNAEFLDAIGRTLDRNNHWELSVSGGSLYVTIGGVLHEGAVAPIAMDR
jgi:uncharacterized protein YaeQ